MKEVALVTNQNVTVPHQDCRMNLGMVIHVPTIATSLCSRSSWDCSAGNLMKPAGLKGCGTSWAATPGSKGAFDPKPCCVLVDFRLRKWQPQPQGQNKPGISLHDVLVDRDLMSKLTPGILAQLNYILSNGAAGAGGRNR